MSRWFRAGAALAVLALAAGCGGGRKVVQVSGLVTFNGQPARNVVVTFQPVASKEEDDMPGRGSGAITGEDGRYTLVYDGDKPGCLTGKHLVRISPQFGTQKTGEEGPEGPRTAGGWNYLIPPEWNDLSKEVFDVPAGGTDKADFHITTKK